ARRDFVTWAGRLIKARDPNHLVSAGLLGYTLPEERDEWITTLSLPEVDYCDAHVYPKQSLRMQRLGDVDRLIDDLAQLSRFVIKKPLVIGEFGLPTAARTFRDQPTVRWFERLLIRARKDGLAGALAWIYEPQTGTGNEYGIFTDDDEMTLPLRRALSRA